MMHTVCMGVRWFYTVAYSYCYDTTVTHCLRCRSSYVL